MEEMDISADPVLNTGLPKRSELTKTSKIVKLQGRIHSNLFNQEKPILNGVDLTVKFHCHKPEICLLSGDTAPAYKITMMDAIFYVKKIELTLQFSMPSTQFSMTKMHSTPLSLKALERGVFSTPHKVIE